MDRPVIYLTAPLALSEAPGDALPRHFRGTAYSGALVSDWGYPFVIDLSTVKVEASMPLLFQHQHESLIGTIHRAENTGAQVTVEGELFSDIDETAADVARKAQRGVAYQMSVGLYDSSHETVEDPRTTVQVNGQTFSGPLTVLRHGTVREVSIVALGADARTNAEFFSSGARPRSIPTEDHPMSDDKDRLAALETQVADLKAQLAEATARADQAQEDLASERYAARLSAVRVLFADLGREFSEEAAAPYASMAPEAFAAISKDLRALKPAAPAHLFQQQTQGEPAGQAPVTLSTAEIYAKRRVG